MIEALQDVYNGHFDPYTIYVKDDEARGFEVDDLLVNEVGILRDGFCDFVKVLIDAAVAFDLT